MFARTLAGTSFTARADDVRVLSPDAAKDAVYTPPIEPTLFPIKGVHMSRLPLVCEGDIVEHVHEAQREEYPAGPVVLTGIGLVTVQPANGAPKWTVDRWEVQHVAGETPTSD
ncbi:hypothetical protein B4N89_18530 [Embleya scabrispora]|uniref:Uncharacterized protein n=1 Tax=Embleya scabrispora TaxID=159449 RepID=A0A1T3P107_9ACTN|nr:hypothetical protein B4N89_18530 [Embleya scabrispora]